MTVRERVLRIRLMKKLEKNPAYARALGIEATGTRKQQYTQSNRMASPLGGAIFANQEE